MSNWNRVKGGLFYEGLAVVCRARIRLVCCLAAGVVAAWMPSAKAEVACVGEDSCEVILLHTNDLHFDFNFLDAVGAKIARFRERYAHVFLFDAGDLVNRPSRWWDDMDAQSYTERFGLLIDVMNEFRYDAMTLGNHELGYLETITRDQLRRAQFPRLGANVRVTTDKFDPPDPYVVFPLCDGRTMAVLGVTAGQYDEAEGIVLDDHATVIEAHMHLREEHDVFVLLTHIAYVRDQVLAERFGEVDVIIGGHCHTLINPAVLHNGVLVAQTGGHPHPIDPTRPQHLGVVRLVLQGGKVIEKAGEVLEFNAVGHTASQWLAEHKSTLVEAD